MWIEAKTPEGLPYFFHSSTRETRWEPPEKETLEAAEQEPEAPAPRPPAEPAAAPAGADVDVRYGGATKEEKDAALGELVVLLKELTTKRVRVQAVSKWFLGHALAAEVAEGCLKRMLDQVAVNLFSDEGPVLQRFKYSLAVLYAVDDIFKARKGPAGESAAAARAAKESEIPNFKGSYLGRFSLVSADFWTSDHLLERSRSVDAFSGTRARGTLTLKRR